MDYNYIEIPLTSIYVGKNNPRKHFDEKSHLELVENIKKFGVLQPIIVRPVGDLFEIVAGERRFRAVKEAGFETIPANTREMTEQEALEIQVIENLHRDNLHPMEEAEGYERLIQSHGYTVDDLAAKVGKSKNYIYGRMNLCKLIEDARKAFYEDEINPSVALLISRIPDPKAQKSALENIIFGHNTYRQAQEFIQDYFMLRLKGAAFDTKDSALLPEAGSCTDCPNRTGNQRDLFPDVESTDVCTRPSCFKEKVELGLRKKIATYEEKGYKVLNASQSTSALHYYDSPYLKLSAKCEEDPKHRNWNCLLGKSEINKFIAIDSYDNDKTYELVLKKDAFEALADKYDFIKSLKKHEEVRQAETKKETPEQAAKRKENEEFESFRNDVLIETIAQKAVTDKIFDSMALWKLIVNRLCDSCFIASTLKRHIAIDSEDSSWSEKDVYEFVDNQKSVKALRGIAIELLCNEAEDFSQEMVKMLKIDKSAISKEAKLRYAEVKKEKAEPENDGE